MVLSGPAQHAAMRCLALDDAAGAAYTLLTGNGVPAVLLKGAGLARLLGTERRRLYCDVDLLVAPATFDTAQQVLLDHGYHPVMAGARPDDCSWHERPWQAPGPWSQTIDLHRGFAGVTDPDAFWRELSGSVTQMTLAGCSIAVPGEAGAALVVGLHAANPGSSTRPVGDLERALEVLPAAVWPAAADLARRAGAEPAFALGLRQVDAGVELAAALRLPDRADLYQRLRASHGSREACIWARFAAVPTVRAKIRHVRLRLLPSAVAMRHAHPLARGPVRLALAYLRRIGYYAWHSPAGLREMRAMGRTAR